MKKSKQKSDNSNSEIKLSDLLKDYDAVKIKELIKDFHDMLPTGKELL